MACTIVFRQKYGFCFFCCHSVFFGCPFRCAVKRFVNCLDHCVIPCTTCLTSLRDWICPKKILLQISESLEPSSLSWLRSKKCSRRPWRKLGIETDERKPVFTSLAEVILDAILFIFLPATSSRKSSRQYARAPRGMTRFVLKIEISSHIIGTRPDLALTVSSHYGSCRNTFLN